MNCLVVVNRKSGNGERIDAQSVIKRYARSDQVTVKEIVKDEDSWSPEGYEKVIVCGGDGTLMRAANVIADDQLLLYVPCGTFNETAKRGGKKRRKVRKLSLMGYVNDTKFTYVCAAGSFTPIGYSTNERSKKLFKILAYLATVIKHYRIYRIPAVIETEQGRSQGEYSLIMTIHSERCFGFKFNRMYDDDNPSLYMLTIRSPRHNGLIGAIEMFFPFFRAFFIGFNREHHGKKVDFRPVENATIQLGQPTDFCIDGDKLQLDGELKLCLKKLKRNIYIVR